MSSWTVIESTPGYLSEDDDPPTFEDEGEARIYASDALSRLLDHLYEGASADGWDETAKGLPFTVRGSFADADCYSVLVMDLTREHDLGRIIELVPAEGSADKVESPAQVLTVESWRRMRSTDYASGTIEAPRVVYLTAEGTTLGAAVIVDAWPIEQQLKDARTARDLLRGDESHRKGCASGTFRTWERDSCGTCALLGWGAHSDETGNPAPNYAGWARIYTQARQPIPRAWLPAFVDALNDPENERYREALRRDVATYGYKLVDYAPGYKLPQPTPDSMRAWLEEYHGDDRGAIVDAIEQISAGDDPDYPAASVRTARLLQKRIADRLEDLRKSLRAENISYGELAELQDLAPFIGKDDVELLEPAGVPEFPEGSESA